MIGYFPSDVKEIRACDEVNFYPTKSTIDFFLNVHYKYEMLASYSKKFGFLGVLITENEMHDVTNFS